jgi:hypothetical protein
MVWYDTTDLTTRPDRSTDAWGAYDRIELSGQAARRESGLSEDDAPDPDEVRARRLWELAKANPDMAPTFLDMIDAGGDGSGLPDLPAAPGTPEPPDDDAPVEPEETDEPALLAACDGLVYRALERAGGRLRSAAGRKVNGGPAAIACDDPVVLHTTIRATEYATLDSLLAGAWDRCDTIGPRYAVDGAALAATLDSYARALLATGHAHDSDRLADALGIRAAV